MNRTEVLNFQKYSEKILGLLYGELIKPGDNFGQISREEAEFLMHRVWQNRPKVVLEIGVASGASSAAILAALESIPGESKLIALDCLEKCYFNKQLDVGFMIQQVFGKRPEACELHAGVSSLDLETILEGRKIDLLFIDGNHSHPWACIDTILALPFLTPGATILYHDINLHLLGGPSKALSKGPHQLYYHIKAADKHTVASLAYPNIGAFLFSNSKEEMLTSLFSVLFSFPWESDAWPILDKGTVLHLGKFIGKHFGNVAKLLFLKNAEIMLPEKTV